MGFSAQLVSDVLSFELNEQEAYILLLESQNELNNNASLMQEPWVQQAQHQRQIHQPANQPFGSPNAQMPSSAGLPPLFVDSSSRQQPVSGQERSSLARLPGSQHVPQLGSEHHLRKLNFEEGFEPSFPQPVRPYKARPRPNHPPLPDLRLGIPRSERQKHARQHNGSFPDRPQLPPLGRPQGPLLEAPTHPPKLVEAQKEPGGIPSMPFEQSGEGIVRPQQPSDPSIVVQAPAEQVPRPEAPLTSGVRELIRAQLLNQGCPEEFAQILSENCDTIDEAFANFNSVLSGQQPMQQEEADDQPRLIPNDQEVFIPRFGDDSSLSSGLLSPSSSHWPFGGDQPMMNFEELLQRLQLGARPHIDENVFSQLPTKEFQGTETDQTQCMVCLEDFAVSERLKLLPCLHAFHEQCIRQWLEDNVDCPICRQDIEFD